VYGGKEGLRTREVFYGCCCLRLGRDARRWWLGWLFGGFGDGI